MGENTIYIEFSIDEASKKHVDDSIDRMGQRADAATGGMGAKYAKEFEQSGKSIKDYEKLVTGLQQVVSNPVEMGMMKDADITLMRGKLDRFDQELQKQVGGMSPAMKAHFNNLSKDAEAIINDLFMTDRMSSSFNRGFQQNIAKLSQTTAMEARKMSADLSAGIVVSPEAMTNMRTKLAEVNDMMFEQITNAKKAGVQIGGELKKPFNELTSATNEFGRTVDRVLVKYSKNVTENKLNQAKSMLTGLRTGETYSDKELKAMVSDLRAVDSQFTNMHKSGTKLNTAQQEQWRTSRQVIKEFAGEMRHIERQQSFMNSGFAKFSIMMSGIAATIFVLQNIAAGIRAIITPFMELESSMVVTERRMGLVGEQADKLKKLLTAPGALGYGGASKIVKEFNELVIAGWKVDEVMEIINGNMIRRTAELEGTMQSSVERIKKWWNDTLIGLADKFVVVIDAMERLDKAEDAANKRWDDREALTKAYKKQLKEIAKTRQQIIKDAGIGKNNSIPGSYELVASLNDEELKKQLDELDKKKIQIEVDFKFNWANIGKPPKPPKPAEPPKKDSGEFDPTALGVARENWTKNLTKLQSSFKELSYQKPIHKAFDEMTTMLDELYMANKEDNNNNAAILNKIRTVGKLWEDKNIIQPLWKQLQEQTGYETKGYDTFKKKEMEENHLWYLSWLDKTFADALTKEEKFIEDQKKLAPLIDIWELVYKRKGIKPDEMLENQFKLIRNKLDNVVAAKVLTPVQGDEEYKAQTDELKYQQMMDHLKRIQDVFKQTGIMTDEHYNLQKLKDDKYMKDYGNEMTTVIEQVTQAKLTAARDMDWIKGPLEDEANLYNMLGIATEEYVRLLERKRNIQKSVDLANPSTAPYAEDLDAERKWLDEQAVLKAKMDAYNTLYSSTKTMSDAHYDNEIKLAQHTKKNIVKLTGEIELANEHMARRQLELDAMRLHSSDDYMEGMKVALREVEMEHKSAAERTADFWRDAHQAMGDSFTDLFYDVLMWEMDSLEDYARAFISSIAQSMANQFGSMASNGVNSLIQWGLGMVGLGSPAAAATSSASSSALDIGKYSLGVGFNTGHTGGIAGSATFGSGAKAYVDPSIFFNAPRFHSGLKPDEFPAILQRGEEVIPRDRVKADSDKVKIINVLDPSVIGDYLSTSAGERIIVNYMQRNKRVLQ